MVKPTIFVQPPWESASIRLFQSYDYPVTDSMDLADVICFNGGEDIHPRLYGQTIIPSAGVTWLDEARDKLEVDAYKKAQDKGLFKFGICRGGQLLNVMNGGALWQDVDGHNRSHDILDIESGKTYWSSSVHHQMFILGPDAKLIATSTEAHEKKGRPTKGHRAYTWYRGDDDKYNDDPEVVLYSKDRALCIQGHPEYGGFTRFTEYCLNLMERYI